jgi:hypothetical protein
MVLAVQVLPELSSPTMSRVMSLPLAPTLAPRSRRRQEFPIAGSHPPPVTVPARPAPERQQVFKVLGKPRKAAGRQGRLPGTGGIGGTDRAHYRALLTTELYSLPSSTQSWWCRPPGRPGSLWPGAGSNPRNCSSGSNDQTERSAGAGQPLGGAINQTILLIVSFI